MNPIALHREVRNAISLADELGRYEHAVGNDELAGYLAATRTVLDEIERELGRSHDDVHAARRATTAKLERASQFFRGGVDEVVPGAREQLRNLVGALEAVLRAERRLSASAMLPLAHVLSQPVHSFLDYVVVGAYGLSAAVARTREARSVGIALGGVAGGMTLFSDHQLGAIQALPIEAHAMTDHVVGVVGAVAPIALGYVRRDPIAAAIQIAAGVCGLVVSLVTDYRASRGVRFGFRNGARWGTRRRRRVPEVQRPLEGYAGSSYLPITPL